MISSEVLAIASGLASAACWGSGDFSGGLATRRGSVYSVVVISQLIGAGFLIALALTSGEGIPSSGNLILGGIAGVSSAIGLVALYIGLVSGRMGVVAPVAAVVAAAIPILISFFSKGPRRPLNWRALGSPWLPCGCSQVVGTAGRSRLANWAWP